MDSEKVISYDAFETAAAEFDGRIRTNYSGRAMYGDTCAGVVLPHGRETEFALALAEEWMAIGDEVELSDVRELFRDARTDSMGLDMILYFPGWKLDGEYDDDDD